MSATAGPTAEQIRSSVASGVCAWCGRGPFKLIAGHVTRKHGIDTRRLRDLAGFTYTESICSPDLSARRAEASREAQLAERMNARGFNGAKAPKRVSRAGKAKTQAGLARTPTDPEQARAALAKGLPAAIAATKKRALLIRLNARHGTLQSYKFGCRCVECKEANRRASQAWRDKVKSGQTHENPAQPSEDD